MTQGGLQWLVKTKIRLFNAHILPNRLLKSLELVYARHIIYGRPIDPGSLDKMFKERQRLMGIPRSEQIEFHGLRKSGQMHKVRLTKNNYQLVAESAGHSPEVLMSNYNEALDSEKRALSRMVERNFYGEDELSSVKVPPQPENEVERLVEKLHANPELLKRLMQTLTLGADGAAGGC